MTMEVVGVVMDYTAPYEMQCGETNMIMTCGDSPTPVLF